MAQAQRVLVAGGGPAAVEFVLALRELAPGRVAPELIAPTSELVVRAYEILAPFHEGREHRYRLDQIGADLGVTLTRDAVASVDPDAHTVSLRSGGERAYDALVVAVGAHAAGTVAGAIPFRGAEDASKLKELLLESHSGRHRSVAFVIPSGHTWPLPLYELALHTSAWLSDREITGVPLMLVTPEPAPLAVFGSRVSDEVSALLHAHGVDFLTAHAVRHDDGSLLLTGGRELDIDLAIAMMRLGGPHLHGLPCDGEGFLPTDDHGRVIGVDDVYAAGDATTFPVKQGGLATQQADAIAELIAATLGAEFEPRRSVPVLQAVLYGGHEKRYLRAQLGVALESSSQASLEPLWPESSKLVGRYLAPYLDSLDVRARERPSGQSMPA
jgi:sulfide:quinone oxidoreductase